MIVTRDQVEALFRSMTGVDATQHESDWEIDNSIKFELTPKQVRTRIAGTEAACRHAVVVGYLRDLGRTASAEEIADWKSHGTDWDGILAQIAGSTEAKEHAAS